MSFFIKTSIACFVLFAGYGIYLDATIRTQFEDKRWVLPTRVYARPMELFAGAPVSSERLVQELKQLGYQKSKSKVMPGTYSSDGTSVEIYSRSFRFWDGEEPARHFQVYFNSDFVAQVLEMPTRTTLYRVRLEPQELGNLYPNRTEDRLLVKLEVVPQKLIQLLFAVEDKDFYAHHGLSLKGILRALVSNLQNQELSQGGSTITQQLVKNFFLTNERSWLRKIQEIPMALLLELHYSKAEILETYLNEVFLGQAGARAIHGFGMASYFYFGRPLTELRLSQLALLVGIVKGPSYYQPWRYPERALERRNLVLSLAKETSRASQEPLGLNKSYQIAGTYYPAFMELVHHALKDTKEAFRVFTTLDPWVQKVAETALSSGLASLEKKYGWKAGLLQGAVVITNPKNGEVLAVVGDREPRRPGFNRARNSQRAIGSLVKPAVYLTALSSPEYHLASTVVDEPITLRQSRGKVWSPQNSDKISHGPVRLVQALAHSYNQAAVQVGLSIGLERIIETLKQLGIEQPLQPNPSLILGAVSLSPLQVANMYQTIATLGYQMPLSVLRGIERVPAKQVFPSEPVYLVNVGMQKVMQQGTGRGAYLYVSPEVRLAGKTGTTDDGRDSWFAGFSENYLAVVWVGRDDYKPTHLSGPSGALPIWATIFRALHPRSIQLTPPAGIEMAWVDVATGGLSAPECPGAEELPFIRGRMPQETIPCAQPSHNSVVHWFEKWF